MPELDMSDLAVDLGKRFLDNMKTNMKGEWDSLSEENRKSLERTGKHAARLLLKQAAGHDITADWADVEAQMANWSWTGASIAKRSFLESLKSVAKTVGEVIASAAAVFVSSMLPKL